MGSAPDVIISYTRGGFATIVDNPFWSGCRWCLQRDMLKSCGEEWATETGIRQTIHLCRDHFKDYRSGRGLFGQTHGLYAWDMQVRGGAATGDSREEI